MTSSSHPEAPKRVNRVALLGGAVVGLGFLLLPLLELKPNRLAPGVPIKLLQLEGGYLLALLAALPLALAFVPARRARGWGLAGLGNALLVLTLLVPALAGVGVLANAGAALGEGVRVSNPRLLPAAALALGLLGGYMVLSGGLQDLRRAGVGRAARRLAASAGVALVVLGFLAGQFGVYSVVVELGERGGPLLRSVVEHVLLVSVALGVGTAIGVGLGLWAYQEARAAPLVLYTVGIIQTVPSLALFGALLVPLARLGDQRAGAVGLAFLLLLAGAAALALLYWRLAGASPPWARRAALLLVAVAAALPLTLFVVVAASLLYRSSALAFTSSAPLFAGLRWGMGALLLVALGSGALRRARRGPWRKLGACGVWGGYGVLGALLLVALGAAGRETLRSAAGAALTVRDLGVSGIGPAPAVVALTLYALLPLVRNTHAGLRGVDPAVTDAGRGVGMTPAQRFFQLELPLALPVILAGVRNAGVALVGIATIASLIGAGGLGDFILGGIVNISVDQILLGTLPAVGLALLLDAALRAVGRTVTPPGLRAEGETP